MLELFKSSLVGQYEAALSTLNACVHRCPEDLWTGPVINHTFSETVFHTLFFTDYYLELDETTYRDQTFHRDHPEFFREYEELIDRHPVLLYDRPTTLKYLAHCCDKVVRVVTTETAESLAAPAGFSNVDSARAELHGMNIRHIQHHSAQLIMRLRLDAGLDMPWVKSGYEE